MAGQIGTRGMSLKCRKKIFRYTLADLVDTGDRTSPFTLFEFKIPIVFYTLPEHKMTRVKLLEWPHQRAIKLLSCINLPSWASFQKPNSWAVEIIIGLGWFSDHLYHTCSTKVGSISRGMFCHTIVSKKIIRDVISEWRRTEKVRVQN